MHTKMKRLAAIGLMLVLLLSVCAAAADGVSETLGVSISVKGTPPETPETYTVRLTAEGDFPMPEGADGESYDLTVTGAASASFPVISYDRVGIYTYSVRQIPGSTEGVQYDTSVFDVKVQVYNNADNSGFEIATVIRKRGNVDKTEIITFVNTYPVEYVSKTVVKVWDDDDNRDGIRPTELTATLTSSEGMDPVTVTLNEANGWTATVPDLPRYQADTRNEITYTWTEGTVQSGYSYVGTGTEENTTTITNRHVPATVDVSVEKRWDDANNQDGIRPDGDTTLRLSLLADGTEIRKVYLREAGEWKATVTGLPKYRQGKEIRYTWAEDNSPAGYTLTSNVTNNETLQTILVNTHETEKTSATIIKTWDDASNQDGLRPDAITATLSNGTEVTLNAANNWRATVDDLPRYSNGREIVYTWQESSVQGYTLTNTSVSGTITTLTNTHVPATREVEIRKVWADEDNADGLRTPVTLVLTASANQSAVATYTWNMSDEETQAQTQTHTFTVPVYNNGNELTYTVDEQAVPEGYVKTVDNSTLTVTNTHAVNQETVEIQITKSWEDDGNRDGIRPGNIVVRILQNGEEYNTVTVTGTGNLWSYTLTGLPRYTGDTENVYTLSEVNVPGYTSAIQGFAITNTHAIETTNVSVTKVWNDNNNANGNRPAELTVTLNADGTPVGTYTLNAANGWAATAYGLPVNANGQAITYTWTEPAIPFYTQTGSATDGTVTTLTNTRNNPNPVVPSTLRITYRYTNGQEAAPPVEMQLNPGDPYDVVSPGIDGYTPSLLRVTGTMPDQDVEYVVLYLQGNGLRILDDYETPLGLGTIFLNIGDCIE